MSRLNSLVCLIVFFAFNSLHADSVTPFSGTTITRCVEPSSLALADVLNQHKEKPFADMNPFNQLGKDFAGSVNVNCLFQSIPVGVDPENPEDYYTSPLEFAINQVDLQLVKWLLLHGADKNLCYYNIRPMEVFGHFSMLDMAYIRLGYADEVKETKALKDIINLLMKAGAKRAKQVCKAYPIY